MAKTQQIKIESSIIEVWSRVPDYTNYEASSLGRIRSITHLDSMGREKKGVIKKFKRHRNGYLLVSLNHSNIELVHRIVASSFLGKHDSCHEINHKDGDKTNNNIDNLEWCTKSQNQRHRYNVLKKVSKKQTEAIVNLNLNKSIDVRRKVSVDMLNSKMRLKDLSKQTGVSISTLSRMRNEK